MLLLIFAVGADWVAVTAGSTNLALYHLAHWAVFAVIYGCLLVYGHNNNEPSEWRLQ